MRRLALALSLFCLAPLPGFAACSTDRIELKGGWGSANFNIEVADDSAERSRGLMHRTEMAFSAGMLFVYDAPGPVSFWMRNTLIPLDMLFIDEMGVVQHIHENAVPLDETPIPGGQNIQFVLEVNGGVAELMGITIGSLVRHPAITSDAAMWPCP